MTYTCAANYVENRASFDQQLVAASRVLRAEGDYPYSRTLADQLVLQVGQSSAREFRFDSVIKKCRATYCGLIALSLLCCRWFRGNRNVVATLRPICPDCYDRWRRSSRCRRLF